MISCSNVSLVLGGKEIFHGLNLAVPAGSRMGIVGDNGAGKTTLFRMISGEVHPDRGEISIPSQWRLGYLPQDLVEIGGSSLMHFLKEKAGIASLERELSDIRNRLSEMELPPGSRRSLLDRHERLAHAYEAGGGYGFEALAEKVLKGLGFRDGDSRRSCDEFSGGWKMRASLASLLLGRPDALLLDEPTNHLDTESMEWLEGYLTSYQGTLLAISHDRRFLDKLTRSTAEISFGKARVYSGNFSDFLTKKTRELEITEKNAKRQEKEEARALAFIERFRYKASKASLVQSRIRSLEKMTAVETEDASRRVSMRFPACPRSGLDVIRVVNVGHSYGNSEVFAGLNFSVKRSEKIALVGVNGAGKSTLTRLLSGEEPPSRGKIVLGHNVRTAFFSQESAKNLDYGHSVWNEIANAPSPCTEPQRRNLLGCFLFSGNDIEKPVSVLSGGEKSRLALLKILLRETNLLILDEPTNHLDMATRDLFKEALLGYGGTIVIVSHDRDFLDALVDRVIEIRDGRIFDYPGNYSYFIEKRAESLAREGSGICGENSGKTCPGGLTLREEKRIEAEKRNMLYRNRKKYLDELHPLEAKIGRIEDRIGEIDLSLSDPSTLSDSSRIRNLLLERSDLEKKLLPLMQRWEELMEALDQAGSALQ